jgi:hypothetical protein
MTAAEFGQHYYCIKTPFMAEGEIFVYADRIYINDNGHLLAWRNESPEGIIANAALKEGKYINVAAATAIERKGQSSELGEVNRGIDAENERRVIDLAADYSFSNISETYQKTCNISPYYLNIR